MTPPPWPTALAPATALSPTHPLFDLQTLDALLHPTATLLVDVADEDQAEAIVAACAALAGPLADPELVCDAAGHPVAVRLDLDAPPMGPWLVAQRRITELVGAGAWALFAAEAAGLARARANGRVGERSILAADLPAVTRFLLDDGRPLRVDRARLRSRDPEILGAVRDLGDALREAGGDLPEDGAWLTAERATGRLGLRVTSAGLDAAAAWAALAPVIHHRMGHDAVRFAPFADLDERLGVTFDLRLLVPCVARLPAPPQVPGPWRDPGPRCADHRVFSDAPPDGGWSDGQAVIDGAVTAAWRAPVAPTTSPALPGTPLGLEEHADDISVWTHRGPRRWFVRARDDLADADLLERAAARAPGPLDAPLAEALTAALAAAGVEPAGADDAWFTPVADSTGAPGVHLRLDGQQALSHLARVLDAVDAGADLAGPWVTFAFGKAGLHVHLWLGPPAGRPAWGPAP